MTLATRDLALVHGRPSLAPGAAAPRTTASPERSPSHTRRERCWSLLRLLLVGAGSSGVDLMVLAVCVRWLHVEPTLSRLLALVVSGSFLFFGCRSFAFRARAGSISRQARLFVIAELAGFPLNLLVFHLLAVHVSFLAPELGSQAANFLVFAGFSCPVRRYIFRVTELPKPESPRALPLLTSG